MSSPITSVSASHSPVFSSDIGSAQHHNALICLTVRGTNFDLPREELTALPETILLCLFPNGLMLEDQTDTRVPVDFDANTLTFVLEFFRRATTDPPPIPIQNPALVAGKAAIIVLKEDLDFYIIPPKGLPSHQTSQLRASAGQYLITNASIFDGLRRQNNDGQGTAEQHLIDMLCASGFDPKDDWGQRYLEPQRACVTSLALALLTPKDSATAVATSQKLLLFWRKPARKCWWDALMPEPLHIDNGPISGVKIWARRVWTLELSITG